MAITQTRIVKDLGSSLWLEARTLQFDDGRVQGFLTIHVKGFYDAMRQAIRYVHCTMETLDYDEKMSNWEMTRWSPP